MLGIRQYFRSTSGVNLNSNLSNLRHRARIYRLRQICKSTATNTPEVSKQTNVQVQRGIANRI